MRRFCTTYARTQVKGMTPPGWDGCAGEFSAHSISDPGTGAMAWLGQRAVLSGKGRNSVLDLNTATRAEVAQMLMNFRRARMG